MRFTVNICYTRGIGKDELIQLPMEAEDNEEILRNLNRRMLLAAQDGFLEVGGDDDTYLYLAIPYHNIRYVEATNKRYC